MKEHSIISLVRYTLLGEIYGGVNFIELEDERKKIKELIQSTCEYGEANSALILGPRGSGKTTIVNDVLDEITSKKTFKDNSLLVKLHGLIHTNDNLALKSITRQLNLQNVVEGKVFGSFAENLSFLLASLKSGQKETSKSVVFILDEFDLFCSHHNQTLLYNLFDISQSAQTAICVLGISCRLDVMELLEKRIKSRFSHRQIFIFSGKQDENIDGYINYIGDLLSLPKNSKNISSAFIKNWNCNIQELVKDQKFKRIIQRLNDIDNSKNNLKNFLTSIISNLQNDNDYLTVQKFQEQLVILERDETTQILLDLSVLELCLIIAMKHHYDIFNNQPMNFEMILTRYVKFANANSSIQTTQRSVIMKAFEQLQNLELITPLNSGGTKTLKEYQLFKLAVHPQHITEAIKLSPGLPTEVTQWASSSIL